jgi:hypothetical protein
MKRFDHQPIETGTHNASNNKPHYTVTVALNRFNRLFITQITAIHTLNRTVSGDRILLVINIGNLTEGGGVAWLINADHNSIMTTEHLLFPIRSFVKQSFSFNL